LQVRKLCRGYFCSTFNAGLRWRVSHVPLQPLLLGFDFSKADSPTCLVRHVAFISKPRIHLQWWCQGRITSERSLPLAERTAVVLVVVELDIGYVHLLLDISGSHCFYGFGIIHTNWSNPINFSLVILLLECSRWARLRFRDYVRVNSYVLLLD